jgi:serine beta-lactamase-like protein LACTB, mitochondrial
MSQTASPLKPRRAWRVPVLLILSLLLVGVVFRLFEPIFLWRSGWQPMPSAVGAGVERVDPAWAAQGALAAERLRAAYAALEAPALSAAVSLDGKPVWAGAIGWADVEVARPIALDSRFRIGSTSKAVTAVAVGALVDAGQLDLDKPVPAYLPELPDAYRAVTLRHLLSHRAGVRHYGLCFCLPVWEHLNRRSFPSVRASLATFAGDPLRFAPGSSFAYSSFGTSVVGAVIEAVSGRHFLAELERAVLAPLGMAQTGGDEPGSPDQVGAYEVEAGQVKRAYRVDNSVRLPGGGLVSTPTDLLVLGNAVLREGLLAAETRAALLTPTPLPDGSAAPQGYALGWRFNAEKKLFDERLTTTMVSHHGTAVGSTSYFAAYPEQRLVISVLLNKSQENLDAVTPHANALVEAFLGGPGER